MARLVPACSLALVVALATGAVAEADIVLSSTVRQANEVAAGTASRAADSVAGGAAEASGADDLAGAGETVLVSLSPRPMLAVVTAWYRENITWLTPFAPVLWIGSKGGIPAPPALVSAGAKVVPLPNIGREAHTYLTYIVDHYDALPEVVVFVQGEIAEHIPPGMDPVEAVRRWAAEAAADGISSSFTLVVHEVAGDWGAASRFKITNHLGNAVPDSGMNLGKFYELHIGEPFPSRPKWYMSALFAARRDAIRRRPLTLWAALRNALPATPASEEAHFMERMWYLLVRVPQGTEAQ